MAVRKRGSAWQLDVTILGRRIRETHPTKKKAQERETQLVTTDPHKALRLCAKRSAR